MIKYAEFLHISNISNFALYNYQFQIMDEPFASLTLHDLPLASGETNICQKLHEKSLIMLNKTFCCINEKASDSIKNMFDLHFVLIHSDFAYYGLNCLLHKHYYTILLTNLSGVKPVFGSDAVQQMIKSRLTMEQDTCSKIVTFPAINWVWIL